MGIPRIYFYSFASLKDMGYSFVCEGCGKEISVEMKSCNGSEYEK
jgi:hypothetical protein